MNKRPSWIEIDKDLPPRERFWVYDPKHEIPLLVKTYYRGDTLRYSVEHPEELIDLDVYPTHYFSVEYAHLWPLPKNKKP